MDGVEETAAEWKTTQIGITGAPRRLVPSAAGGLTLHCDGGSSEINERNELVSGNVRA